MAILQSTSITGSLVVSGSSIDFTDATGINISSITGDGSELTNINASNISSGTISDARLPGSISSDITGNAATATKWATARTITLGGDLTGNVSIDGSANVTLTATVADDSHNHTISNVDGLQTALDGKLSLTGGTLTDTLTIDSSESANHLVIKAFNPTINLLDDDSGAYDFYIHVNSNNFYILANRDGNNLVGTGWETPHPLALEADTNIAYTFGQRIFNDAYHPNADKWTNGRTLTIGDTGKTVDGSGNVSWSRAELGITKTNIDALNIDADTVDGVQASQFLRSDANDTTIGFIAAGDANGTNGSKVLRQRYSGGDGDNIIASIGTMHSSGNWLFGYGIDPKNGSSGYISSFDNFSGKRSAIELGNDYIELHYAPAQATAVGSDITSLSTPFIFDLTNTRMGIGETTPDSLLHLSGSSNNAIITLENNGNGNVSGINFVRERSSGAGVNGGSIFVESVTGHNHSSMYLQTQTAGADAGVSSALSDNNGVRVILGGGNGVGSFIVENGSSESLRINRDGNVGIGTSNPEHKVHIGPNSGTVKLALEWSDGNGATSGEAYSTIYTSGQGGAYPFSGRGNLILQPRNDDSDGFGDLVVMTGATAVPRFIVQASGNTIVKNDLTVQGKVTAEEFHTEFVSASIVFQSGSTKFGDTSDDIHSFSGSLRVTGSGDHYFTDGNVGIGTVSPAQQLEILYPSYIGKDTVQGLIRLVGQSNTENSGDIPSAGTALEFYHKWTGGSPYSVARIAGRASQTYDGGLQFDVSQNTGPGQTNFSTAMTILDTGNVGIGTVSPTAKLQVLNDGGNGQNGLEDYSIVGVADSGQATIGAIGNGDIYGNLNLGTTISGTTTFWHLSKRKTSDSHALELYYNNGSSFIFHTRFDTNGSVGIGTTSPGAQLTVYNTEASAVPMLQVMSHATAAGTFTNNYMVELNHAYSTVNHGMLIKNNESNDARRTLDIADGNGIFTTFTNGKVGIGTTSPNAKLEVAGKTIIGNSFTSGAGVATDYINILVGSNSTGKTNGITFWENLTSTFGMSIGYNGVPSGDDNQINIYNASSSPIVSFNNGGNVGIGTNSPSVSLHLHDTVEEVLRIDSGNTGAIHFFEGATRRGILGYSNGTSISTTADAGDMILRAESGQKLHLGVAGAVGLTVTDNDRVGIGTDSPFRTLHVNSGTTDAVARFESSDSIAVIEFIDNSTTQNPNIGGIGNELRFVTGEQERMRIDSSGNVSIGATAKLTGYSGTFRTLSIQTPSGDNASILELAGNRNANPGNQNVMIQFFNKTGTATEVGRISSIQGSDVTSGSITFHTNDSGTFSEKVRIQSDGNVGIGTTSPASVLHARFVNNTAGQRTTPVDVLTLEAQYNGGDGEPFQGFGGQIAFLNETYDGPGAHKGATIGAIIRDLAASNNGTDLVFSNTLTNSSSPIERMRIQYDGNVGIGTNSPATKLEVNGDIGIGRVAGGYTFREVVGGGERAGIKSNATNELIFNVAAVSEAMRIKSSGNVGIGNTDPNVALDVTGEIAIRGGEGADDARMYFRASDKSNRFTIETDLDGTTTNDLLGFRSTTADNIIVLKGDGNIGMGTTSPRGKLDVIGGIYTYNGIVSHQGTATGTTYTNQWQKVLEHTFSAFSFSNFKLSVMEAGDTSNGNVNADVYIHYKNQNGSLRITATIINYGNRALLADNFEIYRNNSTNKLTIYHRIPNNYTYPTYTISAGQIGNITWYGTVVGASLSGETNDSFTNKTIINGITVDADNSGNVGIGTTSPDDKLHVQGNIFITDSSPEITLETTSATHYNWQIAAQENVDGALEFSVGSQDADASNDTFSPLMTIKNTGKVGIGTTSPGSNLSISTGNVNSRLDFSGERGYVGYNTTYGSTGGIYIDGGGTSNKVLILNPASTGNVGIGTTSPDQPLHIVGNTVKVQSDGSNAAGAVLELKHDNNNSTDVCSTINMTNNVGGFAAIEGGTTAANNTGYIAFKTDNAGTQGERMRIIGNGNVGIGTTSPATKLSVGSENHISPNDTDRILAWYTPNTEVGNSSHALTIGFDNNATDHPRNVGLSLFNNSTTANTFSPALTFGGLSTSGNYMNGAAAIAAQLPANVNDDNFRGGNLIFYTQGTTLSTRGLSEKMRIDSSGNVGIGTTSPGSKLDVRSITTDPIAFFGFSQTSSSSNGLIKLNSGRIPQGGSDFTGESGIIFGHSGGTGGVNFDGQGGYIKSIRLNTYAASAQSDSALVFATSNDNIDAERMRIDSGGNVGIGTNSPAEKLHIGNGTVPAATLDGVLLTLGTGQYYQASDGTKNIFMGVDASSYGIVGMLTNHDLGFRTNNTLQMLIDTSGNVGIGTTNPSHKLHVKDVNVDIKTEATTGAARNILKSSTGEWRLGTNAVQSNNFWIYEPTLAEYVFNISTAGNVGIGTTSPSYKFHVKGASAGTGDGDQIASIGNTTGGTQLAFGSYEDNYNWIRSYESGIGGRDLVFAASSETMRITSDGDVGIGTTSPSTKLNVVGGSILIQDGNGANQGGEIRGHDTHHSIYFREGGNNETSYYEYGGNLADSDGHKFFTGGLKDNQTLKLQIADDGAYFSGNVGIGTNSPGSKLHVTSADANTIFLLGNTGTGGVNWAMYSGNNSSPQVQSGGDLLFRNASSNVLVLQNDGDVLMPSGDVGIGTASPGAHLHIYGAGDEMLRLADSSTTGQPYISFYQSTTRRSFIQHHNTGDNLKLASEYGGIEFHTGTGGAEAFRMAIDSGGNVGIGSVSPVYKLDVAGDTRSNALWFRANTTTSPSSTAGFYRPELGAVAYGYDGSERMRITPVGNVGIGITNPSSKLYVGGDSLGTSSGDQKFNTLFSNSVTNAEVLEIKSVRTAAGSDWTTAGKRIQMKIDATWMGYMQFNGSGNNQGITFGAGSTTTAPGNVPERMRIRQGGDISFRDTSNNEKFYWDASAGSLGIGETSPASPLSIEFSDSGTTQQTFKGLILANSNSTTNNGAVIAFPYGGSSSNSFARIGAIHTDRTGGSESTDLFFGTLHSGAYSEKMRIDSSGNVGIGTTDPDVPLHVTRASTGTVAKFERTLFDQANNGAVVSIELGENTGPEDDPWIDFVNNGTATGGPGIISSIAPIDGENGVRLWSSGSISFDTGTTLAASLTNEKMRIDLNGNVGIGTNSPAENLHVYGAAPSIRLTDTGNPVNYNINATSTKLQFSVESSEKLIIETGGDVGIGVSAASYKLHVGGDTLISDSLGVGVNPNATNGRIDASNDVVAYSTSDIRLKENQHEIIDAVGKITRLKGITFDWKEFEGVQEIHGNKGRDVGVIAQEVEEVLPEIVTTRDNGYKAVKYEKLTPLLIQGIKELKQQNDSLRKELDELKDTVNKLR